MHMVKYTYLIGLAIEKKNKIKSKRMPEPLNTIKGIARLVLFNENKPKKKYKRIKGSKKINFNG